jgi:adenosylcobinamide hydrolase
LDEFLLMSMVDVPMPVLTLPFPSSGAAGEVALCPDLNAQAFILKSRNDDLWEKTLVVHFPQRRRVLSTNDGIVDVLGVANHAAHAMLWHATAPTTTNHDGARAKTYAYGIQEKIAQRLGVMARDVALMGTAADMDNLAVVTKAFTPFIVTSLVTAGAEGNAIRTGMDEGKYIEPDPAFGIASSGGAPASGTVNILILTNARLTDGAMTRAIITATEAKTAAFEDLKIPSSYTNRVQATGTGTDSLIVVPGTNGPTVTYTGGHSRIGDLIGRAVHEAVIEALEKQNGFRRPHQ